MAEKKFYIGTHGPYFYDDADAIDDPDGDFAGLDRTAFATQGQLYVATSPTEDQHVLRKIDIGGLELAALSVTDIDAPTELASLSGSASTMLLAYQTQAGANLWTLYSWDSDGVADSPWVVAGSSGYWVAIGGRYSRGVSRFGSGGNYIDIQADGDLEFMGSAGLVSGGMFAYQASISVAVAAKLVWYEVTSGLKARYEHETTFQNGHELLIEVAGIYKVDWSMSLSSGAAQDELMGALGVNGTADPSTANHATCPSVTADASVSGTGFLDLSVNDVVSLFVMNESGARDIGVPHATVSIMLVGGGSLTVETQPPTTVATTLAPTTAP